MTLAFEYGNSKLLDIVSVADVDAEEYFDNGFIEVLKLRFGRDFELCFWSRY